MWTLKTLRGTISRQSSLEDRINRINKMKRLLRESCPMWPMRMGYACPSVIRGLTLPGPPDENRAGNCGPRTASLSLFEVAQFRGISGGLDDICVRKHDVQRRLTRSASEGRTAIAADPAVDHSAGDGGRSGSRPRRLIAYLARFIALFIAPGTSCRSRPPLPVPRLHFG